MVDITKEKVPNHVQVFIGGVSGIIVSTIVHPLDLLKVRMQLYPAKCTTRSIAQRIVRCEGVSALYNGLSAGIMRQATSTTTRLAVIYWSHDYYNTKYDTLPTFADKLKIGVIAGIAGALAGNPAELALVRMMADSRRDPCCLTGRERPRKYNGVFQAIQIITSTEGFCALWRGGVLASIRSVCVSTIHIGSYLKVYGYMIDRQFLTVDETTKLHILSSTIASLPTAIVTLPVDALKTKYQIRSDKVTQRQLLRMNYSVGGFFFLWNGFTPYYLRLSLHTFLTYFVLHEIANLVSYMKNLRQFK